MKRCPQCGREYDLTMSFCLDDGSELLYGPADVDGPSTELLQEGPILSENRTRAQFHTTERTAVLPTGSAAASQTNLAIPSQRHRSLLPTLLIAAVAAIVVAGMSFAL